MNIPIFDPSAELSLLRAEIDEAISKVLDHGHFILGPEVKSFEESAAEYLGAKHAIGVNSGTDALVIGLRALGIGEGDEVITTSMSFFATAESISMLGAKPVFVDIDEQTFNIDPEEVEDAITAKTRAVLPVHLFGLPVNMSQIMEIARNHNLFVIEDCAQSFGAPYFGDCPGCEGSECIGDIKEDLISKKTGTIGDIGTFSFFPTKNLGGIGDGGLIVTDDDNLAGEARMLRVHGARKKYHNEKLGYNSRLDSIQAAVLGIKLNHIDDFNRKRRDAASYYRKSLAEMDNIEVPKFSRGHVFHQFTIRSMDGRRDTLREHLKQQGIQTNIYFPVPQNELPVYKANKKLPVSHQMSKDVLSLPIWPHISAETQDRVIKSILDFLE